MSVIDWLRKKGIRVKNKKIINQAFVHSSYANEHKDITNNERLEFMGDAVLQVWVSEQLYKIKPPLNEGEMTTLRARLVCEKALSIYAKELNLDKFLLLGTGEERNGGRKKDSILADLFEAFVGALYIDQGLKKIEGILKEVITPRINNPDEIEVNLDYKTKLQEYIQSDSRKTVVYEVMSMSGPSNNPLFKVRVMLDNLTLGVGSGNSKKKAEQNAAKDAFNKMVR
ncbi:MAG TPA: ribonuclease III [Erysipelotrichaceae bacterium]|jgi:ribonuclease-3|nr:ribonuclease III [Erysipelotrichaceae bacterium]HCY06258.1 ribonuclease III [Erysipelotrichaceae bacterium]